MSKAVLMSIQPKWVEKIASGEKTIEVRKTKPKLKTPFKCYIYCTAKGYEKVFYVDKFMHKAFLNVKGRGKVIGEFVCDRIAGEGETIRGNACLTVEELQDYCNWKDLYFWRISDLKIYDKPKELSEFRKPCKMGDYPCCGICDYAVHGMDGDLIDCDTSLTRPPQSWCYVED